LPRERIVTAQRFACVPPSTLAGSLIYGERLNLLAAPGAKVVHSNGILRAGYTLHACVS